MASSPFITHLRELHAKAKAGTLEAPERAVYEAGRRELMRVALAAQASAFRGQPQRESMRVAMALKADVTFTDGALQSVTTADVGAQGFSALLAFGAGIGATAHFTIRIPGGLEAIAGKCRVVGTTKQGSLQRLSFAFDNLDAGARDRLELTLFDFLIQRIP
jgi:hypothetical protein